MDSDVEEGEVRMADKSHHRSEDEVKGTQGIREQEDFRCEDNFEDGLNCADSEEEGQITKKDIQTIEVCWTRGQFFLWPDSSRSNVV